MYSKNSIEFSSDHFSDRFSNHERILRLAALLSLLEISAPTLWRRVKDKNFPQPISLGGRSIGWLHSEVQDWIKARAGLRDQIHAAKSEGVNHD